MLDALNKNSKAAAEEKPKARFRTRDISIDRMYSNDKNFYSMEDIEKLADTIQAVGLLENIAVVYDPCEKGEYRIVAGERRWRALKKLLERGFEEFGIATCQILTPAEEHEEMIQLIIANAYRTKNIKDQLEEAKKLKESLQYMKENGLTLCGVKLDGKIRDVVASIMKMSSTKIAQIDSINNNLLPEFVGKLEKGELTFSAAYELSGMPKEEQTEILESHEGGNSPTLKEVKDAKKKDELGEVSESDTLPGQMRYPDDYETEEDQAEAEKTEEQKYNEEQDAIDRETEKRLQKMQQEEITKYLPSDTEKEEQKVYQLRTSRREFSDVVSRDKTFELQKNDQGYKVGDTIEIMEFADGKHTGRTVKERITYILENHTGIEEGYCIMATRILEMKL